MKSKKNQTPENFSPFANIIGNEHVKNYLTRMITQKAIANSLLFAGPEGVGKGLFAIDFAKMLICHNDQDYKKVDHNNHPDIHIYRPEGKIGMHSIDSMRKFSEEVYMSPFEAEWKIFIIHNAERMLTYGANALLKTFEEPDSKSIIILLSSSPESLLTTILSRCRTVRFHAISDNEIVNYLETMMGKGIQEAQEIAALAEGSLGKAISLAKEEGGGLRHVLLEILTKGKIASYTELIKIAQDIAGEVETSKKQEEELVRESLFKGSIKDLSAAQRHELEKEVEGAVMMRSTGHSQALFNVILSWYRDMHLMQVNGNPAFLINHDYKHQIEQAYQRGEILPLETIQKKLSDAKLSLDRSTPLNMCLEKLFLELNLLVIA